MKMENLYKYVFQTKQTCYGRQYDKKSKNNVVIFFFFFLARVNFCYGVNEQFAYNYIFLVASGFFPFFFHKTKLH